MKLLNPSGDWFSTEKGENYKCVTLWSKIFSDFQQFAELFAAFSRKPPQAENMTMTWQKKKSICLNSCQKLFIYETLTRIEMLSTLKVKDQLSSVRYYPSMLSCFFIPRSPWELLDRWLQALHLGPILVRLVDDHLSGPLHPLVAALHHLLLSMAGPDLLLQAGLLLFLYIEKDPAWETTRFFKLPQNAHFLNCHDSKWSLTREISGFFFSPLYFLKFH